MKEEEKLGILTSKTVQQSNYFDGDFKSNECSQNSSVLFSGDKQLVNIIDDVNKPELETGINVKQFWNFIKKSPSGFFATDVHGTPIFWNDKLYEITGFNNDEIKNNGWIDAIHPNDRDRVLNEWTKSVKNKSEYSIEHRFIDKKGKITWAIVNAKPIKNFNGVLTGFIGIINDITGHKEYDRLLKASEKRFRDISLSSADWIWEVDKNGVYTYCSDRIEAILGYSVEEVVGKTPFNLMPENEAKRVAGIFGKLIANKDKIVDLENWNLSKNGDKVCLLTNGIPILDENGELKGYRGVDKDITVKKKAEEKLEYQANLLQNVSDAIISTDKDFNIKSWNRAAEKVYGWKKNQVLGKNIIQICKITYPDKNKDEVLKEFFQKGYWFGETNQIANNGNKLIIQSNVNLIKSDTGEIKEIILVNRDITELKRTEIELQENAENYKRLFEASPYGIVNINNKGHVTTCNPAFLKLSGYSEDEIIGKHISRLPTIQLSSFPSYFKIIKNIMKGNLPDNIQFEWKHKDGTIRLGEAIIKKLKNNDGKSIGFMGIVRDITDIKRIEKEREEGHLLLQKMNEELESKVLERTVEIERLLKQKDDFINQLGHDLKNPLNPLVNLLPIIEKNEKDAESKKILGVINRNVNYMKSLVVKTIELARLNSKRIKFNFENINLFSEIKKIVDVNKYMFYEKNIMVLNNVPDDIMVIADKLHFGELINNLLSNSVKYSDTNSIIKIDAKKYKNYVKISISDTGIGMTDEQIAHVFDEFYKADSSRHDFESSGLGMTICQRIVELHGGTIWAESEGLGKGSKFIFNLRSSKIETCERKITIPKRIDFINHKGKEILYLNYTNLEEKEYEKALDDLVEFITDLGKYDLLLLINVEGNFFRINQVKNTRKSGALLKPYLKKNAIIGISKFQKVFLKAVKIFSDIELKHFENIEEAKNWLVE